jgi:acyl-CoA thioester hydrolase
MAHRHTHRIIFGDVDPMGYAYYANYLRWFEIGRAELMRAAGYPYLRLEDNGFHFPVTEAGCRYLRPIKYDDQIVIETRISELGRVRIRFDYRILAPEDDAALAEGFTIHACLDQQGKMVRMPVDLKESLGQAPDQAGSGG